MRVTNPINRTISLLLRAQKQVRAEDGVSAYSEKYLV